MRGAASMEVGCTNPSGVLSPRPVRPLLWSRVPPPASRSAAPSTLWTLTAPALGRRYQYAALGSPQPGSRGDRTWLLAAAGERGAWQPRYPAPLMSPLSLLEVLAFPGVI